MDGNYSMPVHMRALRKKKKKELDRPVRQIFNADIMSFLEVVVMMNRGDLHACMYS
jgi:hypothetical protein